MQVEWPQPRTTQVTIKHIHNNVEYPFYEPTPSAAISTIFFLGGGGSLGQTRLKFANDISSDPPYNYFKKIITLFWNVCSIITELTDVFNRCIIVKDNSHCFYSSEKLQGHFTVTDNVIRVWPVSRKNGRLKLRLVWYIKQQVLLSVTFYIFLHLPKYRYVVFSMVWL